MPKIIVVDVADPLRGLTIAKAFGALTPTYFFDQVKLLNTSDLDAVSTWPRGAFDLLVVHNNDLEQWKSMQRTAHVTIRYTGGLSAVPHSGDELWICARAMTSAATAPSSEEVREVFQWLKDHLRPPLPSLLTAPREKALLTAIAILCQGYLAVVAKHGKTTHAQRAEVALDQMGWSADTMNPFVKARPETVEAAIWWRKGVGVTFSELRRGLRNEWGRDASGELETFLQSKFMIALEVGEPLSDPDTVGEAYLSIAHRLTAGV